MIKKIIFLLQVIGIPILTLAILHLPFWIIAKKKKRFDKLDYFYPFIPMSFYFLLNFLEVSQQSLSNIAIEIPTIAFVTLIGYIVKVFYPFAGKPRKNNTKILIGILLIFVFLLCIFMPFFPE